VGRNLTLTLDEELLHAARKVAIDRNTSVNQLVRDYLTQLVAENDSRRAAFAGLKQIFRASRFEIGEKAWTRDPLHDRR
jgi:Family of unknown function (DUF6364)